MERCELPQRGLGRSPSRNRILCILALNYDNWWQQFLLFIRNKCNFSYLLITHWFIKILLLDKTEMPEILVTRRVSGSGSKMRESPV